MAFKYTLKPVAEKLQELLGRPVTFLSDCVGPEQGSSSCIHSVVLISISAQYSWENDVRVITDPLT